MRRTSQNRRAFAFGLSNKEIGFMMVLHRQLEFHRFHLVFSLFPLYALLGAYSIITNPQLFPPHLHAQFAGHLSACIGYTAFHLQMYTHCYNLDYALHDITPEEEQEHEPFRPSSNKHSTLGAINIAMIIRASIRASSSESTDVLIFSRERFIMDSSLSQAEVQINIYGRVITCFVLKSCSCTL
jgi:hypothetical protein